MIEFIFSRYFDCEVFFESIVLIIVFGERCDFIFFFIRIFVCYFLGDIAAEKILKIKVS